MAHNSRLLYHVAASVAVTAVLAAFAAWVVGRFYPRPFFGAFWPCFGGGLLVKFLLDTFNVLEGCAVVGVLLVLSVVSIPMTARFHSPAFPAHAIASVASGMLSSRVFRRIHWQQW